MDENTSPKTMDKQTEQAQRTAPGSDESLSQPPAQNESTSMTGCPRISLFSSGTPSRKRHASASPDRSPPRGPSDRFLAPPGLSFRKKQHRPAPVSMSQPTGKDAKGPPSPLDILALAAASRPHLPAPISIERANRRPNRRVILLNSPFPSPLMQQNKFDLLGSLLSHVDILLEITSYLSPQTLLNLYSVSAPFHYMMDSHFTSFIMASTRTWAPNADRVFPWWCYRQLCIEDPAHRRVKTAPEKMSLTWTDTNSRPFTDYRDAVPVYDKPEPSKEAQKPSTEPPTEAQKPSAEPPKAKVQIRAVPSFRWLKMAAYREAVSREIIGWMTTKGHRIPRHEGVDAIKRMWFLIDIPVNGPRVALIHNTAYFSHDNLFYLQMFFIKLDMLYQDPVHHYGGEWTMRQYLLAERSLTTLWNYLRGKDGTCRLEIMRLFIKHGYRRPQPIRPMTQAFQAQWDAKRRMDIMGVPAGLVGRWGNECWGMSDRRLIRPDELVLREGIRRRLDLQRWYIRMMASGYVDEELNPTPHLAPEYEVLSLIRRRKNREAEERKRREENPPAAAEHVQMKDVAGKKDGEAAVSAEDLQRRILKALTGN